ncbi:MAG: hypothetical protein K2P99_02135 [Burkholderiales bacterium]|nr:hypothetical protein [Burkholderiales bacterium]
MTKSNSISMYRVANTGQLTAFSPDNISTGIRSEIGSITISPNGNFIYLTNNQAPQDDYRGISLFGVIK